jgi:predicted RNA-binding Zn ribbon-like protein
LLVRFGRLEKEGLMVEIQEEHTFELIAGWLCLDFTNTVNYGNPANPNDRLKGYGDLVLWSQLAGTVTAAEAQHLRQEAERRPTAAVAALQQAKALRDALYRIFSAIAADHQPSTADLANLNVVLAEMLARSQLVPVRDGFAWAWAGEEAALERLTWPVAWSAAELLTAENMRRVGECAGHNCGWLFLDTSRNHSRRWCNMRECGNRAKAQRHYRRRRLVKTARV